MKKNLLFCISLAMTATALVTFAGCTLEEVCLPGTHKDTVQNKCVGDDKLNCGPEAFDCISGLEGGKPDSIECIVESEKKASKCHVTACREGYVLFSGSYFDPSGNPSDNGIYAGYCLKENANHCGQTNIDCELSKQTIAQEVKCNDQHKCEITKCSSDEYTIAPLDENNIWTNQCSERNCDSEFCNEEKLQNALRHSCDLTRTGNECAITDCMPGYYLQDGACHEITDEHCGSNDANCNDPDKFLSHVTAMICDMDKGKCIVEKCDDKSDLIEGECVGKKIECESDGDCVPDAGVSEMTCEAYSCHIKSCDIATHHPAIQDGKTICVPQTLEECARDTSTRDCTKLKGFDKAIQGVCENGICMAKSCSSGYHTRQITSEDELLYETCESEAAEICGDAKLNCRASITSSTVTECIEGSCVVLECAEGYHPDADGKTCEDDSFDACGTDKIKCSEAVEHWSAGSCERGTCIVSECQVGYHPVSNTCTEDTASVCGNKGDDCTRLTGWSNGNCENGTCIPTACIEHYHVNDGICEHDEPEKCGAQILNCTELEGWAGAICDSGSCAAYKCDAGYHLKNSQCIKDTTTLCGTNEENCTTSISNWVEGTCASGKCKVTKCTTGFHPAADKECKDDTLNACGQNPTTNCPSTLGWKSGSCTEGRCVATECVNGYTLLLGTCTKTNVGGGSNYNFPNYQFDLDIYPTLPKP